MLSHSNGIINVQPTNQLKQKSKSKPSRSYNKAVKYHSLYTKFQNPNPHKYPWESGVAGKGDDRHPGGPGRGPQQATVGGLGWGLHHARALADGLEYWQQCRQDLMGYNLEFKQKKIIQIKLGTRNKFRDPKSDKVDINTYRH